MANICLTSRCNRACAYCFARPTWQAQGRRPEHMSRRVFGQALNFLRRSGQEEACLLGGEPTLHPRFTQLVELALEQGLRVVLFSNGLMPEKALDFLAAQDPARLSVVLNTLLPGQGSEPERSRQERSLARLGSRALLGLNLTRPGLDLGYLLGLIAHHNLSPHLRLGLAHPSLGGDNHFLPVKFYSQVGLEVADLAQAAAARGVGLEFDCGFVPCMFPPGVAEHLHGAGTPVGLRCNPILDILPNGQVVSCFALGAGQSLPLPKERRAAWLRAQFFSAHKPYRALGIMDACRHCEWLEQGLCLGGCLAAVMGRWRGVDAQGEARPLEPRRLARSQPASPAPSEEEAVPPPRWAIPYVDQPLEFWREVAARHGERIKEVYFPLDPGVIASGRPPQPSARLRDFLASSPLPKSALVNPMLLTSPLAETASRVTAELRRLDDDFGLAGATVSNLALAQALGQALPHLPLTASCLMNITTPAQAVMLGDFCHTIVPGTGITRNLPALKALRAAFGGRLRLLVNEACLPGCPLRVQHFYEMMTSPMASPSLCQDLLDRQPWLRLIGGWILPQHLHLFAGVCDELKLAGRATLRDPERYLRVLGAYVSGQPLSPHEIGGGPASPLEPLQVSEEFYRHTLHCGQQCHLCQRCRDLHGSRELN